MTDVVVIGAGINGLVAGASLAHHKLSTVVLEQRDSAGGAAITGEIAPGFKAPMLSHSLGPISREVVRTLHLDRAGVEFVTPEPSLTTLGTNGEAIVFHRDAVLTAGSIHAVSSADAGRWAAFLKTVHRIGAFAGSVMKEPAPPLDEVSVREWLRLFKVGRQARRLGKRDLASLSRWIPMPIADLTGEFFESDLLRAAIAAHAIFGNPAGPRSAGTGGMWLQRLAFDPVPVGAGATARGGPGSVADALIKVAAKSGAKVRTQSHVVRLLTKNERVRGVVLGTGEEIAAKAVVCAIDPRQMFLQLVDPIDLPPTFVERIRHFRARGVTAKVNLALSTAPAFPALGADDVPLRGRLLIAPDLDYLERAFDATKYGQCSEQPWLDVSIPTVSDPGLAPDRQHVVSINVHFAPRHLRSASWNTEGDILYQSVLSVLEQHSPGLRAQIVGRQILTPEDLEQRWGLSGGHIFHGESSLDQSWVARPLLGWSRHRTPLAGLYLGGAGVHPGGGLTGVAGMLAANALLQDWNAIRAS